MAVTDCHACQTPLPIGARFCSGCGIDVTDPGATVVTRPRDPLTELQDRLTRTLAGRYTVRELLGAGGMAAVFLADEIGLDRPVAIKVLPPELSRDEGLIARFQREARTAAKLDHPHIIPIHRVESESGLHYFVMKYVPGRSLDSLLEGAEPMDFDLVTRILREAALALGHAHTRGVVHRDVKPANIMLDQDGRVVLADFGISKAGETSSLTQTGVVVGTPHYMAPEQALGVEVDGRADQYALGVVAYQMLARQCPFTGDSAHTILFRHIHDAPRPVSELRPDVPPHLAQAIARALAKDPNDRFATMEDFARAVGGESVAGTGPRSSASIHSRAARPATGGRTAQMPDAARRSAPVRSRGLGAPLIAAVAVVLLATGGGWYATQPRGDDRADGAATEVGANVAASPEPAPPAGIAVISGRGDSLSNVEAGAPSADATPAAESASLSLKVPASEPEAARQSPTRGRANRPLPGGGAESAPQPRTAPLTVASEPYGMLYIDDMEIGDTPVANHPLVVGRTYRIRIEREGFKTRRETITVADPNAIRRSYVLEPGESR